MRSADKKDGILRLCGMKRKQGNSIVKDSVDAYWYRVQRLVLFVSKGAR